MRSYSSSKEPDRDLVGQLVVWWACASKFAQTVRLGHCWVALRKSLTGSGSFCAPCLGEVEKLFASKRHVVWHEFHWYTMTGADALFCLTIVFAILSCKGNDSGIIGAIVNHHKVILAAPSHDVHGNLFKAVSRNRVRCHGFPLKAALKRSTSITIRNSAFNIGRHSGPVNKLPDLALFHPKMRFMNQVQHVRPKAYRNHNAIRMKNNLMCCR